MQKALLVFISGYSRKTPKYVHLSVCKCSVTILVLYHIYLIYQKTYDFNQRPRNSFIFPSQILLMQFTKNIEVKWF